MWRRFTRLKRERPWVDCLTPFSDFIQNMGNRERERERLRERKRKREREKEREREREGETYTEQPETIRVQREHSTLNNAANMHACKTSKQ